MNGEIALEINVTLIRRLPLLSSIKAPSHFEVCEEQERFCRSSCNCPDPIVMAHGRS
jgi:hypothetical protein